MARRSRTPAAVNTIGVVRIVCSSRLEIRLYTNTSTTKAVITTILHL
jgi:hypothetical protein